MNDYERFSTLEKGGGQYLAAQNVATDKTMWTIKG